MTAEYYVWLQQVLGFGSEAMSRVLSVYGTAKAFWEAPDSEKIAKCRLSKVQAERLHKISRRKVYSILNESIKSGINIITPEDELYPIRLRNIPDPPAVLYVKGEMFNIDNLPVISIVGPRKISFYGERCAYVVANTLSSAGFTVVSGGAVGGDKAAHIGALDAGGKTIAVLGAGINSDYLKTNADLRERIAENGCLITEYPTSTDVTKGTFQQRNRILSGLADGVIVIEGGERSGTLITARHAAEQGRDVFVVPGSPSLPQYAGSNRLLSDGAKPLLNINDVISEYALKYPCLIRVSIERSKMPSYSDDETVSVVSKQTKMQGDDNSCSSATPPIDEVDLSQLSDSARNVYEAIGKLQMPEFTADDIVDSTAMDVGDVLGSFTELEIFGMVVTLPGGRFKLV